MKDIILINAKARFGKDSLATYICEELEKLNKTYLISHNAGAVKDLAYSFYNWDGQKDEKGRKLLIDITDTGYSYDEFFWEKKNKINELDRDVYIIPDWRYLSSFNFFKDKGYNVTTIHIDRPGFNNNLSSTLKNDKSEQGFKDFEFDYEVINNSLEDLKYAAKKIAKNVKRNMEKYSKN